MFKKGSRGFEPKDNRIPSDAKIVYASYKLDFIELTLESNSFEPVEPGAVIPRLDEPTFVCKDFIDSKELIDG